MHLDVQDLKNFYYRTNLGRVAQRAIRKQMAEFWSSWKGETVVGFGFAVPLLRPYLADARRVVALMPGPQGVMHWPSGTPNASVLCEETLWPLQSVGGMLAGASAGWPGRFCGVEPRGAVVAAGSHAVWIWAPLFLVAA